jgi:hypothetical protein
MITSPCSSLGFTYPFHFFFKQQNAFAFAPPIGVFLLRPKVEFNQNINASTMAMQQLRLGELSR